MSPIARLLCILSLTASAASATPRPPNIVLITLDTVRADRMGFLGSKQGLTPNLDALARQSVVFTRAYAQVPLTTASHATILTGTYPQFHKVNDFDVPLAKNLPYAPAILSRRGYHTAAFVGSIILDPGARFAPGFERGFDTYDAGFHRRRPGEDRYQAVERRGQEVVARALTWLKQHPRAPFFLWVHLYDAHDPYDPPEPYKGKYAAALYDGEIAYADSAVGKLLGGLREQGLYDSALVAVMADHGEALGQHGENTHGVFLYDETIHVPLLFKFPNGRYSGTAVESRAELVDVLPTLLQATGFPIPAQVQGKSLLESIAATHSARSVTRGTPKGLAERPAYSESDYPQRAFGWSSVRSWRTGKYLFIEAPRKELYDATLDPKSEHNLASASAAVAGTLSSQLETFRQRTTSSAEAPRTSMDPEQQQKLSALGYIGSDSNASTLPGVKNSGADPKDKIEVVNLLHQAILLGEELRYEEAIPLLEEAIVKEPGMPIAYLQLGTAFTFLKNYERALPVLRKVTELRPELIVPRYELGLAMFATGDVSGAAQQLEMVVASSPEWAEAHFTLGTAYARHNRMSDAIKEYQKVVELRPNHFGAHLLLGRALALSGNPTAAIPNLIKAAALQPQSPEPHLFLADAYNQLGRQTDAERERADAQRLQGVGKQ